MSNLFGEMQCRCKEALFVGQSYAAPLLFVSQFSLGGPFSAHNYEGTAMDTPYSALSKLLRRSRCRLDIAVYATVTVMAVITLIFIL